MNTTLIKTGRIVFAIPVFIFGLFHFMNAGAMAGMVPSYFPGGIFWVYLTGAGLIAASVSIVINVLTRLSSLLLAGMLLIFIVTMHIPGVMGNDEALRMMSMTGLFKDLAMAGGALVIAGLSGKEDNCKTK